MPGRLAHPLVEQTGDRVRKPLHSIALDEEFTPLPDHICLDVLENRVHRRRVTIIAPVHVLLDAPAQNIQAAPRRHGQTHTFPKSTSTGWPTPNQSGPASRKYRRGDQHAALRLRSSRSPRVCVSTLLGTAGSIPVLQS